MIIKGTSRGGPGALAAHLSNAETNERVSLIETRGTVSQDLRGALIELDAYAEGTRCQKALYHAAISPEPPHRLSAEQREEAINALEDKLGLTGHARIVVMHEKKDREHIHVVWSRINLETGKSVSDSHNYRKHEECARDLERRFGHERVQGALAEREGVERPDRTPSRADLRQEERTGITGKQVKAEVTAAFRASDNADAFKAALEDRDYILARGDRRDFVIVDRAGGIHSLARRIDGVRATDLREFMKRIARDTLPSAGEARDVQIDRAEGRASAFDERQWEDALVKAAIEKDKADAASARAVAKEEAKEFQEASIKWEADNKRRQQQQQDAHDQAAIEAAYGRGEDYVSQSSAALKDNERILDELNEIPRPLHTEEHRARSVEAKINKAGDLLTDRTAANPPGSDGVENWESSRPLGPKTDRRNYNEAADNRHKVTDVNVYGDGGHESSLIKIDAQLRNSEKEKEDAARRAAVDPDVALGARDERVSLKEAADKRYKATNEIIYGDGGYDQSLIKIDAQRRNSENESEAAARRAAADPAVPLGSQTHQTNVWESSEESAERLGKQPINYTPATEEKRAVGENELLARQAEESTRQQEAVRVALSIDPKSRFEKAASETTEERLARLDYLLGEDERDSRFGERDHPDPDRQHEAPGGGRTRGR